MDQNELVAINFEQCNLVADVLQSLDLRQDFYQREYLHLDSDRETLLAMHFFAVAICHQTHKLHHPVLDIWGWDYIEFAFVKIARNHSPLLDPAWLAKADYSEISKLLLIAFSHTGMAADSTLDRIEERATLMQEAAHQLVKFYGGKLSNFFHVFEQNLEVDGNGLYNKLSKMKAFSDSMHKKSTFLIKLLIESGLIAIADPENFIPIMDYHMQRVLLRLGCVEIVDDELRKNIQHRIALQTDEPVRSACIEAFRLIAEISEHDVTKMNDFFWSLGRSCCHETTLCIERFCSKKPCTFALIVKLTDHSTCAFENICLGAVDEKYRKLWQPVVETHFY